VHEKDLCTRPAKAALDDLFAPVRILEPTPVLVVELLGFGAVIEVLEDQILDEVDR
jgi:hypothetical protein